MKFFSFFFVGYVDPTNKFLIIKINNLWGDLSSISAKTATLVSAPVRNMDQPTMGIMKMVLFDTNLKSLPR